MKMEGGGGEVLEEEAEEAGEGEEELVSSPLLT